MRFKKEMPSTRKHVKRDRKRVRSNESDTEDEFEPIRRKNGKNPFIISEILKNYQQQTLDNNKDNLLKYVPAPVSELFIPYMKHVQMINTNFNLINSLLKSNVKLLKPDILSKFQDLINKTGNKMNKFSGDLIEQLASNYNQNVVYDTLKASCQEPIVNLEKIEDPEEKPTSNASSMPVDNYDDFMDSDIDLQISEICDNVTNDAQNNDLKAPEPVTKTTSSSSNDCTTKQESNGVLSSRNKHMNNLQFDDNNYLVVYTDGCCLNNGRNNAQAGVGVWFNFNHPLNLAAPVTGNPTNNNAEIQAATRAIRIASELGLKKIKIRTDSMFLINCMTTWMKNWKKNNWRTADKQPVKNRESLEELDSVQKSMDSVLWDHIAGHTGCPGNEAADALAKQGAQKFYR
ncbi:uncharacterized protein LOC135848723 isoform X2 [Planococcus citri]|uniref:uncharacterized protein LOC135848723 isoform X2 n=1 Tax=Planococcus citri TaxID=170843 RepID=UPI0031F910F3